MLSLLLTRQSEINPSATNLFSPFASFSQGLILMLHAAWISDPTHLPFNGIIGNIG